ncbi:MAG: adenylate kinase family protein [Methanomicrobiaceae archaeon]|nr:adenylate kinase family protein [Methanomicrobiaceae archaeon]
MMTCITGTPGTGKTAVAECLADRGHKVIHIRDTITPYVLEEDDERDTLVIDTDRWASAFPRHDGIVEGHLAHMLSCDAVVILRCRPDELRVRLSHRGYREEKIRENSEAEALDVILVETLDIHPDGMIFEIDTTTTPIEVVSDAIEEFMRGKRAPQYGNVDWSAFLVPSP